MSQISDSALKDWRTFKPNSGWDFLDIWTYMLDINGDEDINRGYPVLRSIYQPSLAEIQITIFNPHAYGDNKTQLGDIEINLDDTIFDFDENGVLVTDYGVITNDATNTDTTKITFTYSVPLDQVNEFIISNTSYGVLNSVIFGPRYPVGELDSSGNIVTSEITNYKEYIGESSYLNSSTDEDVSINNNDDVLIMEELTERFYGLFITFDEREFNVNIKSHLDAHADTDGVLDTDIMTVVLVHTSDAGAVDYAYTVDLGDNGDITLSDIFNGNLDVEYEKDGYNTVERTFTKDEYGYWTIYAYLPIFYKNDTTNVQVSSSIDSNNPTLDEVNRQIYDVSSKTNKPASSVTILPLSTINNTNIQLNCLGSFKLDSIVRDITIEITIYKPLEYWLHATVSNGN